MGVSAPSLHRESTDSLINIVGMSWPVTYGEVVTLAQEFLEGLSPPTLEMMVFKPLLTLTGGNGCYDHSFFLLDSERSFSGKNNLPFNGTLVQKNWM